MHTSICQIHNVESKDTESAFGLDLGDICGTFGAFLDFHVALIVMPLRKGRLTLLNTCKFTTIVMRFSHH